MKNCDLLFGDLSTIFYSIKADGGPVPSPVNRSYCVTLSTVNRWTTAQVMV